MLAGEEKVTGWCRNCGYQEERQPEELEYGSECPQCGQATFGGPKKEEPPDPDPDPDPFRTFPPFSPQ